MVLTMSKLASGLLSCALLLTSSLFSGSSLAMSTSPATGYTQTRHPVMLKYFENELIT